MQVAAEHAETQRASSRKRVEERLLFDGIAVHRVHVPAGRIQLSAAVEADLAHPREARLNGAAVAAGEALHPVAVQRAVEGRLLSLAGKLFGRRFHKLSERRT